MQLHKRTIELCSLLLLACLFGFVALVVLCQMEDIWISQDTRYNEPCLAVSICGPVTRDNHEESTMQLDNNEESTMQLDLLLWIHGGPVGNIGLVQTSPRIK